MRDTDVTNFQDAINKINARQNFTYDLSKNNNRYIVSQKNVFKGKNPSLFCELPIILRENMDTYDSFGGWYDEKTNLYHVDFNFHLSILKYALMLAKENDQIAIYDKKENKVIYLNNI